MRDDHSTWLRAWAALWTAAAHGLLCGILLGVVPAHAVVIASGDGTGNTEAPADDPGFDYVGPLGDLETTSGLTGVYLGDGWVLSAWHTGQGQFRIGGRTFNTVAGSRVRPTGPGSDPPDLQVIRIDGDPELKGLDLATKAPGPSKDVILIGNGRTRSTNFAPCGPTNSWSTNGQFVVRWGTNKISHTSQPVQGMVGGSTETQSLGTTFDAPGTTAHESQAVLGDSGGALFWKAPGGWVLAGVLWGTSVLPCQGTDPQRTAVEGDLTLAADLAYYRAQILAITAVPACSDGLDDDGDGLTDHPADPGCDGPDDVFETSDVLVCDDGKDNDGDGLIDYPDDPQCTSPTASSEALPVPASAVWGSMALAMGLGASGVRQLLGLASGSGADQSSSRTLKLPRLSS